MWLLDQVVTFAAFINIFRGVHNPNPGVHPARLPDLPTPWVVGNHLQQERGGVHTRIRVVHTAEDVS